MAPRGGNRTDISDQTRPGVLTRARQALSYVTGSTWMAPGQPLRPSVPGDTQPRRFDFRVGTNQQIKPRVEERITFETLRALADSCDVLRLVIETRKDQLEALDWQIRPRAGATVGPDDPRIKDLESFFRSPDKETDWSGWLRQLLEDLFVLDAVAIYKRPDKRGRVYSLNLLDAASITLKVDENGFRPVPPYVAYQQVIKGVPFADFTSDEMLYWKRNPRTQTKYGMSPVEQIIVTINTALRRTASQLSYYVDGNLNAGIFWMPETWTAEQCAAMNEYWESEYAGNTAGRSKAKFLPGGKDSFQQIIQPPMKDEFDEWLARVICYAFSVPPTPFIKQMNRATAETSHDAAMMEGLAPLQKTIKGLVDKIITEDFDAADLEFAWIDDREIDPQVAAEIQDTKIKNGTITVNEARAQDGLDPYDGVGDIPCVLTATGMVPIPSEDDIAEQKATSAEMAEEPPVIEGSAASKALAKKYSDPLNRPVPKEAIAAIHKRVQDVFDRSAHHVATQLRGMHVMAKSEDDDKLKAEQKAKAQRLADDLNLFDLADMKTIASSLGDVASDSASSAMTEAGVETALFGQVNQKAVDWASTHAAELVSQITDSTRDMLRQSIAQGLAETDIKGVADTIAASYGFSEERSLLIADTETAIANGEGALRGYKHAQSLGIKIKKQWLDDPLACPVCVENALAGPIELDEPFPSGHLTTPAHPRCSCSRIAVIED